MLRLRRHLLDGASRTFGRMAEEKDQESRRHAISYARRHRCGLSHAYRRWVAQTKEKTTRHAYRRNTQSQIKVEDIMLSGSEQYYDDIYAATGKDYLAETDKLRDFIQKHKFTSA